VKYPTPERFRAALEDRLRQQARTTGLPLVRLRKGIVFERLLARLLVAAPDRWVLKGGLALDYRLGAQARTTKDMDLGRRDDAEAATADLMAAAELDLGDYFRYAIERTDALARLEDGAAVRYRVHTDVAARLFEHVVVDVGFDTPLLYDVERVRGHGLLAFADLEPPEAPTIPLAYHVAEKVHPYTRHYGSAGRESTRVKDLVDLVLIARGETSILAAGAVRIALDRTFAQRDTHPLPATLPAPPTAWMVPYRKIAGEVGLASDIAAGHAWAAAFLDSILDGTCDDAALWQPNTGTWTVTSRTP